MVITYVIIEWPWALEGQVKGKDLVHVITRGDPLCKTFEAGTVCDFPEWR